MPQSPYEGKYGKVALHAEMKADAARRRKKAKADKKKTEKEKPKPYQPIFGGKVDRDKSAGGEYRRTKKKILRDAQAEAKRDAEKADTRIAADVKKIKDAEREAAARKRNNRLAADVARMKKEKRDRPFIPAFKQVSGRQPARESRYTPFIGKGKGRARTSEEYLSPSPSRPAPASAPKKKRGWARKLKDALGLQFSKGGTVKKSRTRKKFIDGIARKGHTKAPHK